MWRPGRTRPLRPPKAERQAPAGSRRDRLAVLLALVTVAGLGSAFFLSKGTQFLMPGPLTSAHGSIENCSACHAKSGSGKMSWIHGLTAGDPLADSKACLTCHKMPDTAFNAHSASAEMLKQSTGRLTKIAAETPAPRSARAQSIAFPTHDMVARGLSCATCHQEHGVTFGLNKISNEQCRSCHVVQFDSFDRHHPKFENYPFKRRTRIVYDHAGHFGKHYPEVAKKDPAKRIPDTCSSCHNSRDDKLVMAVAPFERTCSGCHLDQIAGKARATGPKGIAFLALPGLDVPTLTKKNAPIGEWPDASDAALTPFMKVMISRNERGRALVKTVNGLNLQDLSHASDDEIKAVTNLVWEIKGLFHALIKGKASDVLGDLNIGAGAKLSAPLVADLTASIPRDVVVGAQQEWLPNLGTEMANRPGRSPQAAGSEAQPERAAGKTDPANVKPDGGKETRSVKELPPAMRAGVEDAEKASKSEAAARENDSANAKDDGGEEPLSADEPSGAAANGRRALPTGTPRAIEALRKKKAEPEAADGKTGAANVKPDGGKEAPSAGEQPRANEGRNKEPAKAKAVQPEPAAGKNDTANSPANGGKEPLSAGNRPQDGAGNQSDDLLFPTEQELREIKTGPSNAGKAVRSEDAAGKADAANAKPDDAASARVASEADASAPAGSAAGQGTAAAAPQTKAAHVISIGSDVDPEAWAEYGGWYRQDYAIFYRPTGHKDKFIYSWLFLTGPQAPKGDNSPAAAVFDVLTHKDAQGSCTKCHSVDDIQGKGRLVNFSPLSVESKQGRFTNFIHEPHFGIMENRGCLTCHSLAKDRPYLKGYEQGNPQNFSSNFGEVKKDLCQTCHASNKARQDCLLCHNYHVNGVVTPIMTTRLPIQ